MKKDTSPDDATPKDASDQEQTENAKRQAAAFQPRQDDKPIREAKSQVHYLDDEHRFICDTGPRGHAMPEGRSKEELVVDATEGFIPLWAQATTLRWRFQARSLAHFANPKAAMSEVRKLFGEALLKWGHAVPVKFSEDEDVWDFEIVVKSNDDCDARGCVLASAFFPDSGRHEFVLYPRMFSQSRKEQVDTFCHEIGHIFGLRHFFANVSESGFPSEIFGTHNKFTIMNYGMLSELTPTDKDDLTRLYKLAWSGELTEINGTPIRLVQPYHTLLLAPDSVFALRQFQPMFHPQARVAHVDGR